MTCIKLRNFLSNILYMGINKEDFYNENFIFDIYWLMTKNLNPSSLDRKLSDQNKHDMIYMIWKECVVTNFYKHICSEDNFLYLNGKNVPAKSFGNNQQFFRAGRKKLCAAEKQSLCLKTFSSAFM